MKRTFLFASAALVAIAASAQYNVDPTTKLVADKNPSQVDYLILSDGAVSDFEKDGAKVNYIGPAEELNRFLYIWDNTFNAGDGSMPRVDMEEGTYIALEVSTVGWSGGGFFAGEPGISTLEYTDDTRLHVSYMTPSGNGPASVALILFDGDPDGSAPAKFAVGTSFNDEGASAIYPTVGEAISDDWKAIDISLGDLKKIWPSFNLVKTANWTGNILSFLGGGVTGQTLAFDATYLYNLGGSGVNSVDNDTEGFVVTGKTVNTLNGNGIELYGLDGKLVKKANCSTLGLTDLNNGIYVVRSGSKTQKVVVR